ncbi:uncharacterized protein B0I36DRAFT_334335 [Microdochium trichocladiopsis]|uniref:Uncharacterized protein n=1 Tax=Microdochium trichocladiopsis TaxID=1682393 RepID=A0A9P9BL60_9PEZI|nr:uncharacterized protein B0I36DRAFT_334335 [Microdochium trichocladiopsis]KAH7021357.1 hypothetical protein B0I36DRAFT_334335 [Microdochium trichocladiopsis]
MRCRGTRGSCSGASWTGRAAPVGTSWASSPCATPGRGREVQRPWRSAALRAGVEEEGERESVCVRSIPEG